MCCLSHIGHSPHKTVPGSPGSISSPNGLYSPSPPGHLYPFTTRFFFACGTVVSPDRMPVHGTWDEIQYTRIPLTIDSNFPFPASLSYSRGLAVSPDMSVLMHRPQK